MSEKDLLDAETRKLLNWSESALKEVERYKIELDADPVGKGLSSLHEAIAKVQSYSSRVTEALIACTRLMLKFETNVSSLEEMRKEISRGISIENDFFPKAKTETEKTTRIECVIAERNPSLLEQLKVNRIRLSVAERTYKTLKMVLDQLEIATMNISRQRNTIETQIRIGEVRGLPDKPFEDRNI